MNLKQLKETVDAIYSHLRRYDNPEELTVCVLIAEPSMGARASVGVEYVSRGMDWENGQINVKCDTQIVRKGNSKEDIIAPYEYEYDYGNGKKTKVINCKMCESGKPKRGDNYCSHCGQRLR